MCKFHICVTSLKNCLHGHQPRPAMGLTMYFQPCEIPTKTSRDRAIASKAFDHVLFSTVLADGRCLRAHVPPHTGNGLLRDYLW